MFRVFFICVLSNFVSAVSLGAEVQVELFDCEPREQHGLRIDDPRKQCDTLQTVNRKPSGVISLVAIISDAAGNPLVGTKTRLEVVDTGGGKIAGGLLKWRQSEAVNAVSDNNGVVKFAGLLLAWNLDWWVDGLAVIVETPAGEQQTVFPVYRAPRRWRLATRLKSAPQYVIVEAYEPRSVWYLTFDGKIPTGTAVRWYVEVAGKHSKMRKFTTRELSSTLRLTGSTGENVYPEDDGTCYTLVVEIGAPISLITTVKMGNGYRC